MHFLKSTLDWFLHLDDVLPALIKEYGTWTYLILFLIIFAETGLVIIPFLPGDSLLFTAGVLASLGDLNLWLLILLLIVAAFLGDTVNYHVGKYLGPRIFSGNVGKIMGIDLSRFLKKEYLEQAQAFYEKHGGKAIVLARFVPIVRTFAPFIAGMGHMHYLNFMLYNLAGGVIWVVSLTVLGYKLAENVWVKEHIDILAIGIVLISIVPVVIEYFRNKAKKKKDVQI